MDVVELRFTGLDGILDVAELTQLVASITGWLVKAFFCIGLRARNFSACYAQIAFLYRKTLVIFLWVDFVFRSSVNLGTFSILKIIVP